MPKFGDLISRSQLKRLITPRKSFPIEVVNGVLKFHEIVPSRSFQSFVYLMNKHIIEEGSKTIEVDVEETSNSSFFPEAVVPLTSAVKYYRSLGYDFKFTTPLRQDSFMANIFKPIIATTENIAVYPAFLSHIWEFSSAQMIHEITESIIKSVSQKLVLSEGIIAALDWMLYEVMDNVIQHAKTPYGFVMAQVHVKTKHLSICVADSGIGILGSLSGSKYHPRRAIDAITLAIGENVTRDKEIGQGNGLWGLFQIVAQNKGGVRIVSGSGALAFYDNNTHSHENLVDINKEHQGTSVDFQLDVNTPVDVAKALKSRYPVISPTLEKLENQLGERIIMLKEHGHGYGTRASGIELRNFALNILNDRAGKVILDFDNVAVISSSFADELVGRLVQRLGFYGFTKQFELRNVNAINQAILDRSVLQRMSDSSAKESSNPTLSESTEESTLSSNTPPL